MVFWCKSCHQWVYIYPQEEENLSGKNNATEKVKLKPEFANDYIHYIILTPLLGFMLMMGCTRVSKTGHVFKINHHDLNAYKQTFYFTMMITLLLIWYMSKYM